MSDEESPKYRHHDNSQKTAEYIAKRERKDPCLKENELAMKCLDDNGYDRSQCKDVFKNYKNCRKFWSWVQIARKRDGIQPYLPPPEERESVKQQYLPKVLKSEG